MSKTLYKCGCQGGRFKWNQVTYGYCADCYDKIVAAAPAMYEALKRLVDYVEIESERIDITHGLDCAAIHGADILALVKEK